MSPDEGARAALPDEVERVVELASEGRAALADERGGALHLMTNPSLEEIGQVFDAALDDQDQTLLVGTYTGVIVGYALVRSRPVRGEERLGVVDELYVEPDARQVGVGAALLAATLEWCEEQRCLGVDAVALPGDRATKNFFESFHHVALTNSYNHLKWKRAQ